MMAGSEEPRRHDDRGSVAVLTAGVLAVLIGMVMLVLGGSEVLRARSDAFGRAASAARAGAQALNEDRLVAGAVEIDEDAAVAAAQQYLASVGAKGTASVDGTDVVVTVTDTVDIPYVGQSFTVDATATVSAIKGTSA